MSIQTVIQRDWTIARSFWISGKRKPFLASYKLTTRCNLRCQPCPFWKLEQPDASFDKVRATLDRLAERGNQILIFEGGEPTLWQDDAKTVDDVIAYARERFLCVGMTTNGLRGLEFDTDVLWVSIDGLAEMHNRLRGAPIFERVLGNVRASRHPRLFAHVTINADNACEVPALMQFLAGEVRGMTAQFYYPYSGEDPLTLSPALRSEVIDQLLRLKAAGVPILNSRAGLKALQAGGWPCQSWLFDNAEQDGSIRQGCYVRGRGPVDCQACGFTPYIEMSLAQRFSLDAILTGARVFFSKVEK
jgi:MoaA/NifB/PqqE/SkfB family radical SAM enzyme